MTIKPNTTLDLLIVEDDEEDWQRLINGWAKEGDLNYEIYGSGVQALLYLRSLNPENLPRAYLVDMKLGEVEDELEAPLEIFRYVERHQRTDKFRFTTAHLSEHDEYVKRVTRAQVLLKTNDSIPNFVRTLARGKRALKH